MKTIVFVSNYFNHHQRPFSNAMYGILGDGYKFIETVPMEEERLKMGWKVESFPSYVITYDDYDKNKEKCIELIDNADVVIIGSAPNELILNRIKENKLVFRCAERMFKKKTEYLKYPIRFYRWNKMVPKNKPIYMLCSSAYTSKDFAILGLFKGKCFKWGYFPETKKYENVDALIENKKPNSIIWVARFIDWKHPEIAIEVARRLKQDGFDFELNMIGNGVMLDDMKQKVVDLDLGDKVHILGSMKPEEVREYMEKSKIHLFTSDRREGWGAVLNESMNSACAVVANKSIGATSYLINDGENGFSYKNIDDLYEKVKWLLQNSESRSAMAKKAYESIINCWNAEFAANRFMELAEITLNNEEVCNFEYGPCSKA